MAATTHQATGRRERIELLVFLLLLVPAIALGFGGTTSTQSFTTTAAATLFHDIGLSALVLFFVWGAGERFEAIGWTSRGLAREIGIGALLYVPMALALALVGAALGAAGFQAPSSPPAALVPRSAAEIALAFVLVAVVAVAEELVFRGYLLVRLRAITGSTPTAVLLSSLLFASGHMYSGPVGVLLIAVLAVLLSLVYLWRRSLVAPIVLHFVQDFIGLVVVPALWLR